MPEAEERAAVVAEAMTWLRTPYHHRGRLKGVGTDCAMILAEVFEKVGLIPHIEIEHYPQMTRAELARIGAAAQSRHNLQEVLIIHRHGRLACHERIVLVTVWSAHRAEAFAGCQAIVDALKTRAPFWKKEISPEGALWVPGQTPQDLG